MTNQYTETENGALAYKTSENNIVDFFMMFVRDLKKEDNFNYIEKCWKFDPKKTIAVIFNGRDRKNGKKEKKIANDAMRWLSINKPLTYKANLMTYINDYGRWKDALNIAFYHNKKPYEIQIFAEQLQKDIALIKDDNKTVSISLCAKWAPSENDRNDRKKRHAKLIASQIFGEEEPKKMEKYRKEILVPLRKHLEIIENKMCSNQWDKIDYKAVPAVASKRSAPAFTKHDKERYEKYLESVKSGEVKMKTTGILPHELTKYYIDNVTKNPGKCDTIELQWDAILEDVRNSGTLGSALAVVDLSGSMFSASNGSIPAQVAIALGIITARCCNNKFKNKFITFSQSPELRTLSEGSLYDAYNEIVNDVEYGLNTDFLKCCECIINYGIANNIQDKDMPKKLFVFSDMQFDQASQNEPDIKTLYQIISNKFKNKNYSVPKFIYWNLNSDSKETFPVKCSVENTAMVSGFSEQLLKIFMKYDEFNPDIIVEEILKPYLDKITIVEEEI